MKTKIEWTNHTWNVLRGCSRVSEGCRNCYAEGIAKRFSGPGLPYEGLIARTGQWNGQIKFVESKLSEPLRWKKARRVFVNSMSDLFHENVDWTMRAQIFTVMAICPQHVFQCLTKRPRNMQDFVGGYGNLFCDIQRIASDKFGVKITELSWPLKNVWLGVSVENQETANERIPLLLQTPAAVRWISAEPLIGSVDLTDIDAGVDRSIPIEYWTDADDEYSSPAVAINALTGKKWQRWGDWEERGPGIDWVVAGGESGRGARPSHPGWFRSLRDQCVAAGTRFFFKQWGDWFPMFPEHPGLHSSAAQSLYKRAVISMDGNTREFEKDGGKSGDVLMRRVGKRRAGRLLDGEQWDQYPEDI